MTKTEIYFATRKTAVHMSILLRVMEKLELIMYR